MSQTLVETPGSPETQAFAILRFARAIELTDDQFFALCQQNRDLRLERKETLSSSHLLDLKPAATIAQLPDNFMFGRRTTGLAYSRRLAKSR
jgi:hypothetical protein